MDMQEYMNTSSVVAGFWVGIILSDIKWLVIFAICELGHKKRIKEINEKK